MLMLRRKVHKVGDSLMLAIPVEFVKRHGLKAGDEVAVLADNWLQVVPFKRIDEVVEEVVSEEWLKTLREIFGIPEGEPVIIYDRNLKKEVRLISK